MLIVHGLATFLTVVVCSFVRSGRGQRDMGYLQFSNHKRLSAWFSFLGMIILYQLFIALLCSGDDIFHHVIMTCLIGL